MIVDRQNINQPHDLRGLEKNILYIYIFNHLSVINNDQMERKQKSAIDYL